MTERATLTGHSQASVTGINSSGQAVGSDFDASGTGQPVFWQGAQPKKLPIPAGYLRGGGTAINKFGQPVGVVFDSNDDEHAVKWSLSLTGPTELNLPSGAEFPQPEAISDLGEVVGQLTLANDDLQAVSWNGTAVTLLPVNPLDFNASSEFNGMAFGINAAGVIAGSVFGVTSDGNGFSNAVRWNGTSLTILGNLGGPSSVNAGGEARGLNDSGWIVGDSNVPGSTSFPPLVHAVLWKGTTVATDLGALLGANGNSYATGINNSGQIVGRSDSADGLGHAVLWHDSGIIVRGMVMVDLNDATRQFRPSDIVLTSANAVADNGEIDVAAVNTTSQEQKDYLLTPHYVTTTTLASAINPAVYNQHIRLEASVRAGLGVTVTGVVTFKEGARLLGAATLNSSGQAFLTKSFPAGVHLLTAQYGGNTKDLPSTSAVLHERVARAGSTTTLTSSINPASVGQTLSLTAVIHPADGGQATGIVVFRDHTTTGIIPVNSVIGTVRVATNGHAVLATHSLPRGMHNITAVYGGDRNVIPSSSIVLAQKIR